MKQSNSYPKRITVVSGDRGTGKTEFCEDLIQIYRGHNHRCAGILQPARYDNGAEEKTGFDLINLETDERKPAGRIRTEIDYGNAIGKWTIDTDVFTWANEQLANVEESDLLVIDELGPLEFTEKSGLTAAFRTLRDAKYRDAYVVIRPECIADFRKLGFSFRLITLTQNDER